ncbi:hypothetical protein BDZ89DRAFT_1073462 [Hymenopellis radicata]|nr:hypothetical protein BDZ89DRAFT_1073462 [Hymenopellis radicata]
MRSVGVIKRAGRILIKPNSREKRLRPREQALRSRQNSTRAQEPTRPQKCRWSPTSQDAFANYGYGPNESINQQQQRSPSAAFNPVFNQQRRLLSLNIPQSPAIRAYSPVPLSEAPTVCIRNLPHTASLEELLNLVHFGPLVSIDATIKKLALHGRKLHIGWAKPNPSNASRNVFFGNLDENMTEEELRDKLTRFGLIDQVKIVRDKNIGFVHFLSIAVAIKVVNTLPTDPNWAGKHVNYGGKDRCAFIPKSQREQAQAAAAQSLLARAASPTANMASPLTAGPNAFQSHFSPYGNSFASPIDLMRGTGMNRTVYLDNIHPETSTEDLCDSIRGGVLQSIHYVQDRHTAFVTFVDPAAAFMFFQQVASYRGMTINNRRLKIGWGRNPGPLTFHLALAVHNGATRNVCIGDVEDFEMFTEERLKRDFGEYGDIEHVNFSKEENCAFVNFTNISSAIKAIEGVKNMPEYANLRIAHGKDRCANALRSGPQGASGQRRATGNTGASPSAEVAPAVKEMMEGVEDVGEDVEEPKMVEA